MINENEDHLKTIMEFIKTHRSDDRSIVLQTFYGEGQPKSLVSWSETRENLPWFFEITQVSFVFSSLLNAFGEATGFCRPGKPELQYDGIYQGQPMNCGFADSMVISSIPKVSDIMMGSCTVTRDIFSDKGDRIDIFVRVNGSEMGFEKSIRMSSTDQKSLLADLLYPIVTVGLGEVKITYEFIEAFIGWLHRENN